MTDAFLEMSEGHRAVHAKMMAYVIAREVARMEGTKPPEDPHLNLRDVGELTRQTVGKFVFKFFDEYDRHFAAGKISKPEWWTDERKYWCAIRELGFDCPCWPNMDVSGAITQCRACGATFVRKGWKSSLPTFAQRCWHEYRTATEWRTVRPEVDNAMPVVV